MNRNFGSVCVRVTGRLWQDCMAYAPDKFNQRVLQFIDDHKKAPFFIYYPLSLSHNPFEPTPDSKDPKCSDWQTNFEDMVAYADKLIGKVIKKLKDTGIYDNTIIFYTADNGTKTLAHVMKDGNVIYGGKGTQTVQGVHVPLMIKYDGVHSRSNELVDFTDFYPTIAEMAGIPKSELSDRLDDVSLMPTLQGKSREGKLVIFSIFFSPLNAYIRDKQYKYYLDGRVYDLVNDPRELKPFYSVNDISVTSSARKYLKQQLFQLLAKEQLSTYPAKEELINVFGKIDQIKENNWMLGSCIFDKLEFVPRMETISFDITDFLGYNPSEYTVEFSRSYRSTNSELTYADAQIKSVKILEDGNTIFEKDSLSLELTTKIDVDKLRRTGNPIISFIKEGNGCSLSLAKLTHNEHGKKKLELKVDFSNPQNQWGDRIKLYVFLHKLNSD